MKLKHTHLAALTALAMISSASAAVTAFINAPTTGDTRTDTLAQAGFGFYATTLGTKQVNQLGFWVAGSSLAINHDIALYNYNGTNYTQIAGATVLAGATADANGFAWVSIPTITLTDNQQGGDYYIVMASVGTDTWVPNATHTVTAADTTFGTLTGNGWYSTTAIPGVSNTASFTLSPGNGGFVGPNIGYAIPEPSAALLGGLGGLGMLALLRRRR